jgi:hypothetical protein
VADCGGRGSVGGVDGVFRSGGIEENTPLARILLSWG